MFSSVIGFIGNYWWVLLIVLLVPLVLVSLFRKDLARKPALPTMNLKWANGDDSLEKVFAYVFGLAEGTIGWYRHKRQPKRFWGLFLRLSALLLTAAAGLVPLSSIPSVWSTVMIAAAGVCVSVDLFMGYTSGWVRYMLAQQRVERLRDAFLMDWNTLRAAKATGPEMLERAKTFVLAVGKAVDEETQEWAAEFRKALNTMEKARREAAELERAGAVEVTVKSTSVIKEWALKVDGTERGRTTGKNLAVTGLPIGVRKLEAFGKDGAGKDLVDAKTVKIEGGAIVAKEMELS